MKMLKSLLIVLMTVLTVNSFATVHTVFYGTSTNVICFTGDTIRFKDMTFTPTMVSIQKTSGPVIITSPMFTTPDGSGKIIDYVVVGDESAYQMNHTAGSSSGTITVNITTGVNSNNSIETNIKIFPNPVVDFLNVSTPVDAILNIFNINGQLVMTTKVETGDNKVEMETLSSGVYFANVNTKTIKIIKQ